MDGRLSVQPEAIISMKKMVFFRRRYHSTAREKYRKVWEKE